MGLFYVVSIMVEHSNELMQIKLELSFDILCPYTRNQYLLSL